MEIIKSENGGEVTLKLRGCLDTTATADFAAAIDGLEGASALVLEMTELEFISSSALRKLVAIKKQRGADFAISLTGLDEVFEVR